MNHGMNTLIFVFIVFIFWMEKTAVTTFKLIKNEHERKGHLFHYVLQGMHFLID